MSLFAEQLPQRVLVTGGGSGIGLAVAQLFASAGSSVGIIGRSKPRLDAAVEELSRSATGMVVPVAADVTDETSLRGAISCSRSPCASSEDDSFPAGGQRDTHGMRLTPAAAAWPGRSRRAPQLRINIKN